MKVKTAFLFSNGNTCLFDDKGEQIGELQSKGWMDLWFEWLESKGVDPREIETIETNVNGRNVYVRPFKTEDGNWNVQFNDF